MLSLHEHLSELVKIVLLCMLCSEIHIGTSCKFRADLNECLSMKFIKSHENLPSSGRQVLYPQKQMPNIWNFIVRIRFSLLELNVPKISGGA